RSPKSTQPTYVQLHKVVKRFLKPTAIGQCIQHIKEQGSGCGDARKSGSALAISIACPNSDGIFWGNPYGPSILKAKTGPGFPRNGLGRINKLPVFVTFRSVDLIHGLECAVNRPSAKNQRIKLFFPKIPGLIL